MDILVCLGFIFCYNAKNVNFLSTIIYLLFTSNENEQIVLVFFHCLKDVREGGRVALVVNFINVKCTNFFVWTYLLAAFTMYM